MVAGSSMNPRFVLRCQLFLLIGYMRIRRNRAILKKKQMRRIRKCWVRSIFLERDKYGQYHTLFQELKLSDREYFYRYLRMFPDRLEHLLSWVGWLVGWSINRKKFLDYEDIGTYCKQIYIFCYVVSFTVS